jgi:hypothetical protein
MGSKRGLREDEDMKMKKMVRQVLTGAVAIAAMATLPGNAFAGPITGFLGIGGGIVYDTVGTTGGAILDWQPAGGGTGVGLIVTTASGYFNPAGVAGIDFATQYTIRDLTNVPALSGAPPLAALAPAGPVNVPNFLSNFVDPDGVTAPVAGLHFDLTEMVANTAYPACNLTEGLGDTCVLGNIFVLSQSTAGLRILLDVRGFFRNFNTMTQENDEGFFEGAFSTTFSDLTFQQAYNHLFVTGTNLDCPDGQGGRIACTFDANFTPVQPIPEPASLLLFGTGSTLLALRRRRNNKK